MMRACQERQGVQVVKEATTIRIDPDSELSQLLENAATVPVVLESKGVRYTVTREEDIWAGYDPVKLRDALHEAAGMLTEEEGEELKQLIYEGREKGTRPIDRP